MPSALETLIKILRLEQETGYKNTAVIGGLESYSPNWRRDAFQQAKTPQQQALIEELSQVLARYSQEEDRGVRQQHIKYMLGRITGRVTSSADFVVVIPEPPPAPVSQPSPNTDGEEDDQPDVIESFLEVDEVIQLTQPKAPLVRKPKPRRASRKHFDLAEATAALEQLNQPVTTLKGVGATRAEQLAKLGLYTLNDLLFHFPRRYDDYTRLLPINRLLVGQSQVVIGTVKAVTEHIARANLPFVRVILTDGSGDLKMTFFNQAYLKRLLKVGMQIVVYGKIELYRGEPTMNNPEWEPVDQKSLQQGSIVPVYPLTKGVGAKVMRKLMHQVVETYAAKVVDYIPASVLDRTQMVDLGWALRQVHFPQSWDYIEYAIERLAFDELLLLQLGVLAKRQAWQAVPGVPLHINEDWLEQFKASLPYELTTAQLHSVEAIRQDVAKDVPMNRLLQGDVGSGKTVVATFALALAITNGKQAALMAPTSILAEQHYQSLSRMLMPLLGENLNIQLLTGATPEAHRQAIYSGLAEGSVSLVIGTHALIQRGVNFADLALAVIDEQHRFGVEERGALRGKGVNPHILVMTATPIPRTLALTLFADLDLTVLDEMPPGRTPIDTRLLFDSERLRAYGFIHSQLEQGRQAFIIYPLVEASATLEMGSAVEAYEDLQKHVFPEYRLGLLHGRMSVAEKDAVMEAFASGQTQLLVSTTVIEVGIDIPNASVILIEGANRFGLAQLHQLRGRVGRGQHPSYCLLISASEDAEVIERLKALETTTDGFALAELDWKLRGPGDLLGTRQAGFGAAKMDSIKDIHLVELAQYESQAIYAEDPALDLPEHTLIARRIEQLQRRETDLS